LLSLCYAPANIFSDAVIPPKILALPDHLQPRPKRRVDYCLPCIKKLTETVKANRQFDATEFCVRVSGGVRCQPCCDDKGNHACDDIPSEFNRAVNILVYLQQQVLISKEGDEVGTERRVKRVRAYANALKNAIAGWKHKAGKDKDWAANRRASLLMNMDRHEKGLGGVGDLTPSNYEVDTELESMLYQAWLAGKQWWFLRVTWFGQVE
jgi:hypothetical protein